MSAVGRSPPRLLNAVSKLLLISIPILLFPIAAIALCYNYAALILIPQNGLRRQIRRSARFKPQTVLITGTSTPAGLRIARALYQTGHKVIGVRDATRGASNHARWSKAVAGFRTTRRAESESGYIQDLLNIVLQDKVSLWIDCSDAGILRGLHAQAKHIIGRRTSCVCLIPEAGLAENFQTRYDLQDYAQSLGLPTLETHRVRSRNDVHSVLNMAHGKQYRLTDPNGVNPSTNRVILPRRTSSQTYQDVSKLKITQSTPWVLEQYIDGLSRYSTCAVVVMGKIQAFVVYSSVGAGLRILPPATGLAQAMRTYVEDLASRAGSQVSCHMSIDFCVDEKPTHSGVVQQTLPIEGSFTVSPALVLFTGKRGSIDLTKSYLSALAPSINGLACFTGLPYRPGSEEVHEPDVTEEGLFVFDHNVYSLVILPLLQMMTLEIGPREFARSLLRFVNQLCFWKEASYEFWDPLPSFWLYLVYTPSNLQRWLESKS